ncbi:MAG: FKBP-type peptidyl-prolyl cis-trans isomerase [Prevotella sp.]|uniref:FKBP-type peptidyl-prolyl cis-trans isomerase N-terminal domain-containing protein n=1 Tax=Prevotella sp. TaxID=59823 RepID=UPI002A9A9142|nr:FKBP-type peptidyl-prolyl cis-trans isomerase [Prevotella sp.]MDD7189403.1 FKBP-type peptidyl-prolyl cis-trans isomerase [Prevotella sp.]MDY5313681.1 FKBP-type peptidyl-prolyl cis-trans isomerase [Prevotella sp.]
MKTLKTLAIMATAALTFSACGNSSAPRADLKTDIDSMSYAIGLLQSQYVRQAIQQGQVIDTTYIDDFVKGINEGVNAGDDKKKAAYIMGLQVGQQLSTQLVKGVNQQVFGDDSTKTISLKNLLAGFITGATGKTGLMTPEIANQVAQSKMEQIKSATMTKQYGANKVAGEKWLAVNKKKPGVVTLPSGLQYKVIKEGKGAIPADTTTVKVQYEGRTIDGKVFESSYKNGNGPVSMVPAQMIPGWTQALTRMPEGSIWEVYIPQQLAYKERQAGNIKPFSTLIFKIELVKVGK